MDYHKIYSELPLTNKARIYDLHRAAYTICDYLDWLVDQHASRENTDLAVKYLEELEFDMQEAWGFDKNSKKHTWWLKPKSCTCPKLDNVDPAYFGNGKIIVEDCPIHGWKIKDALK